MGEKITFERLLQLKEKLKEYQGRMDPYKAPEQQMSTICKIAVLERLLETGEVDTNELEKELRTTYETSFDPGAFLNACFVIRDYVLTGGQAVVGGTGLPKVH